MLKNLSKIQIQILLYTKIDNEEKTKEAEKVEKEEKNRKSVYRVIYNKETKVWNIKKDGAKRIIDSRETKEEALKRVKELSENSDSNFVVYKKDGKFQKK